MPKLASFGRSAFELMADQAPVLISISGPDGLCTWFNRTWLAFVGRSLAQEVGEGWVDNVHPDDRAALLERLATAIRSHRPFDAEYRLRRKDGLYRWMLANGMPHFGDDGVYKGYISSATDITEHKRVEQVLRDDQERFRLMLETAPVMIWQSDASGRCRYLNRRLREFWRVSSTEVATFDWASTIHPEDAPHVLAVVTDAVSRRAGFALEARYRGPDGEWCTLMTEAQPNFAPSGEFLGHTGANIDLTQQRRATAAHRLSEERFTRFMDHLPGLAWIKDRDGRYVFANEAAAKALGIPSQDLLGRCDNDIFTPELALQFNDNDAAVRASPAGLQFIERLPQPDGTEHRLIVSKFAIPDETGTPAMIGGVGIDVTDHVAAEERVRELNTDLTHRLEEQTALLAALPVGVFIARDAACTQMTMNEAGARMLRNPPTANPSKTAPSAPSLPFRVYQDGHELAPTELIMQRASRLGRSIHGVEVDMVFADGSAITLHESASPLFDEAGRVRGCVAVFVDITERKQSERQKSLLIDELNHRVKNTLSIVQSIANQTLRLTPDPETFTAAFTSRLAALARTHALLTQTSWEGSCLDSLLSSALSPFEIDRNRIVIEGPPVSVRSSIAVTLSLVLHELATNAVKHGALSTDDGRLAVTWSRDGDAVSLQWQEMGGPPVGAVKRRGFGSRLIAASADQLGGSIDLDYAPTGLSAKLVLTP